MAFDQPPTPFTLGVISDIQYARKDDTEIHYMNDTNMRYYSMSLSKTALAVSHFNAHNVSRVLHLGDIIDGNHTPEATAEDLAEVISVLSPLRAPQSHVLGNHCLEVGRKEITHHLHLSTEFPSANESVDLTSEWRMLLIDTMACSVHGPATESLMQAARDHISRHPDAPNSTDYNGGLGVQQTNWLRSELCRAQKQNIKVIIAGHHPISAEVAPPALLVWQANELMQLIDDFKSTVKAVFSGHFHYGGYAHVRGVHHVVFESILDSGTSKGSYGIVSLHHDRIEIEGHGGMTSRTLKF